VEIQILIVSYVLRNICDLVINTNVLSVKEALSMTRVKNHVHSLTRMCVFFVRLVLYSVGRRTSMPFTVNIFIWKIPAMSLFLIFEF